MLVTFLIMLREGLEAALIVAIVAGFLKQSGHSHMIPKVWLGVLGALILCALIGYGIYKGTGEIPQQAQAMVAGSIALIAVGMLTYMILWMKKAARSVKQQLQDSVTAALKQGNGQGWALVGMAFLAVVREGIETVFFLLAVFQQSSSQYMPLGAVLGLVFAIVIGWLIYEGSVSLNLAKFFRWTGVFLIFVAAGLIASAFRGFHNAGLWQWGQEVVFNWSSTLNEKSPFGILLGGIFGYTDHPTVSDLTLYFGYLIPALFFFLYQVKRIPAKA
ncbi:FTR1 family iron permease [Pasteurellaceae bacterium HPA106]|uniref:iron uptake transporter permease EfeU n=1 Tax=Spirabiliibacterium pneumoniae TaxID=221400 RepID=UPI001AAD0C2E|nr:iron uptake transporter permease EfeU [Spirabiliibacterium pneumoniae]MBE2895907.1 FTR1 family iron permease [Spirabiliibacterium pneumoniae]